MAAVPSVSIGNYKGVMLCNRPFAGGVSSGPGAVAAKQAFVCGNVGDKLGACAASFPKSPFAHSILSRGGKKNRGRVCGACA